MNESRGDRFSLYEHMGVTQINFDIDHQRFFVCSWFLNDATKNILRKKTYYVCRQCFMIQIQDRYQIKENYDFNIPLFPSINLTFSQKGPLWKNCKIFLLYVTTQDNHQRNILGLPFSRNFSSFCRRSTYLRN